ncbi:MAG: hypothetical protein PHX18_07765 [Candidatus Gastranaerophilales bacterium]|nr:hypothetical protein [Candidatus Gastranaerophilales bacterium]
MKLQNINHQQSFGRVRTIPKTEDMEKNCFRSGTINSVLAIKKYKDAFDRVTPNSIIDLSVSKKICKEGLGLAPSFVPILKIKATPRNIDGKIVKKEIPTYAISNPMELLQVFMKMNDETQVIN